LNIEDDLGIKKTTILLVDVIIQKDGFINKRSRFLEQCLWSRILLLF